MSTNSRIRIKYEDGTSKGIYCHWDGYVEHNGVILQACYPSKEKVEELIGLGNISSLNETIETCVAYHRDRGEELEFWEGEQEYNYDYDCRLGVWFVTSSNYEYRYSDVLNMDNFFPVTESDYLIDSIVDLYEREILSDEDSDTITKESLIQIARDNVKESI